MEHIKGGSPSRVGKTILPAQSNSNLLGHTSLESIFSFLTGFTTPSPSIRVRISTTLCKSPALCRIATECSTPSYTSTVRRLLYLSANWASAVDEWTSYMTDPAYVRVNGKPVLFIINMGPMRDAFGSSSAVAAALNQLRAAAQAKGLPGVFVVGGFGVPEDTSGQDALFPDLSWVLGDGYDAFSMYNYPYTPVIVNGMLPFSSLSDAGRWTWTQCAAKGHVPFIPVAMDGWDPRPWNESAPNGDLVWYNRTPSDVTTLVSDAIAWANANPAVRPEPPPAPPLVLMEAWNELGEGSYLVPTVGDGSSYGDSLAAMLTASAAKGGSFRIR